ncbi:Nuclear transport factor 2B-like protein [Drosera capensis]
MKVYRFCFKRCNGVIYLTIAEVFLRFVGSCNGLEKLVMYSKVGPPKSRPIAFPDFITKLGLYLYPCKNRFDWKVQKEAMEEQVEVVGRAFVDHYYNLFDNDRPSLSSLYHEASMLTFEGQRIQGAEEISSKLSSLPFDQCRHFISTVDSQPSLFDGGILVFVSGSLQLSGEEHYLRFSQMFHLVPTPQGSFYVQNDIFRLNYG